MVQQLFVDLEHHAADRADEIADGLDGLDIAEGLFGRDLVTDTGQIHKHDVAQRILREVGNADDRDVALGLHPLMGLRVLQLNRIIHGSSSQINFSVFFMSVFRPADAGRTLLISEADLSGEAVERGVELRVVEAVVHLREAAAQANDIL